MKILTNFTFIIRFFIIFLENESGEDVLEIILIAHRGTQNVIADIQIAMDENPNIIMSHAEKYENAVLNELVIKQKCKITSSTIILHTGFSLGGYLAAASLLSESNQKIRKKYGIQEENVFAVTLDAPGFKNSFYSTNRITNYVTRPNLVNTCNKAIGKVIQILIYKSDDITTNLDTFSDLIKEIKDKTLPSHNLENLVEVLKKRVKTLKVANWPEAKFNFSEETFKNILSNLKLSSIPLIIANLNYRRSNEVSYLDDDKSTMV